jgi:ribA/ribD-fused uncharacterized protein
MAFLSNFYPAEVRFEGLVYQTAENAFQAAKTLDPFQREWFMHVPPGAAKREGQRLHLRPMWDEVKLQVMETILRDKFSDPGLAEQLLATGTRKLIEGNTWGDEFWGVDLRTKQGKNHLGRLLMKIRKELRDGA